ncbi:MAG: tetratricopeptide repeat protein [Candidatus Krumholzibacteriia bacterium]
MSRTTARVALLGLGLAAVWLAGCQTSPARAPVALASLRYAADADSLGLDAFLRRSAAEQASRRSQARTYLGRAAASARLADELRALRTAVGLDPTSADGWVQLAHLGRWFGDYQQAEDALAGFAAASPLVPRRRHELAAEAALVASWLRYDRGEWKRGLAWADSAAAHGAAEDEVQLLRALHLAGLGRNRRAEDVAYRFANRDHRSHWIYGMSYWHRAGVEAAHAIFTGRDASVSEEVLTGPMAPEKPHAAECFRDFARVEELMGNWWEAERLYESAMASVPGRERTDLLRLDHPALAEAGLAAMPVWLAFDRYYVMGSLSAYTDLAYRRYREAGDPASREFWASAAVDAAGCCLRLDLAPPLARRVRGLILADAPGRRDQARQDLEAAQRALDARRVVDLETLTTLARLYLRSDRPAQARPLLERAVAAAPDQARAWSDLGLARIQLGEPDLALTALETALGLDPDLAVAWYNRGLLRFHLDDLDGAVADLERAHDLAPADPDIATLLDELRRLRDARPAAGS